MMNQNLKDIDISLLLQSLTNSNIDTDAVLLRVEEMRNERFLEQHKYTIWQGGDNNWLTYVPDAKSKYGRKQISAVTEDRLKKKLIRFYQELKKAPTFKTMFKLWTAEKLSTGISQRTIDKYNNDFVRFFGTSILRDIKMAEIDEEILSNEITRIIREQGLTSKAYSGLKTVVSGILKYSYKKKTSEISPTAFFDSLDLGSRIFTKNVKSDSSQVYSTDDTAKLISVLENDNSENRPKALGVLFTFRTGLRAGELEALKYEDIEKNVLHVRRMHVTNKSDDGPRKQDHKDVLYAKTDAGIREIILTPKALDVLAEMRTLNPNGNFIFMQNGNRIYTNTYNSYLSRTCKRYGIQYRSMHKIRKTYGTLLLDNNVDDRFVMKQMGHRDISTTQQYYRYCNKTREAYESQINKAISI